MFSVRHVIGLDRPWILFLFLSFCATLWFTSVRYRRGLRRVPGPFFASFLPLDRLLTARSGRQQEYQIRYHRKYGPLVRTGPYHVSLNDPALIADIYAIHTKFEKSGFYSVFDAKTPEGPVPTTFSITSEESHRALKRPIGAAYALSTILLYEPLADSATELFEKKLDKYQNTDVDLGTWLHWYAFDVISAITFSNQLGFMEKEEDIEGMIKAIEGRQEYNSFIGEYPVLDKFLLGNRYMTKLLNFIPWFAHVNTSRYIINFTAKQLAQRKDAAAEEGKSDLVSRFKRVKGDEQVMTDSELLMHAAGNVLAGSDTTAITLRALIYYACKNPKVYKLLTDEVLAKDARGELSEHVTWQEAQQMPYFQACVKEALRIHPPVGMMLERVVPTGGAVIGGVELPEGTIIGANPWTIARNESIYGDHVDEFRPERWLDADESTLKRMEKCSLAFGAGSRTCTGKHIAMMEVSKLIPQLLRHYHIQLANPDAEWKYVNYWFVRQTGLICKITRRDADAVSKRM